MKPIKEYDLANEAGEFKKLPAGIYGVRITDVIDVPDKEYLEVYCDIVKGEYAGYFKALVDAGQKNLSRHFRSYKANAIPFFKAFIKAIEKSNPGYEWDWDESKLVGKVAIGVFGEEEYLDKDGNVKVGTKLQEFRSIEAYKEGKIKVPELKKLERQPEQVAPVADASAISDDDLPF